VKTRIRQEPQLRWLADQAASHLSGDDRRFEGEVRRILFQLRMRERWADRLRHLRYITVTPTVRDFEAFRFPKHLSFLYQLIRPFRLVRDYALSGKRT
jgi:hypothetical protein